MNASSRRTSTFLIGLFVIVGLLLGVFALGWFGEAQNYFRKYQTYVSFFDRSVRGLDLYAPVTYQGIDIGHIQSISVAPDRRHAEITMKIRKPELVSSDTYASVETEGLAGAAYINLAPASPGEVLPAPKFDFEIEYPVIPTQPSRLDAIAKSAQAFMAQLQGSDIQALIGQAERAVRLAGDTLGGTQMKSILASLDSAARGLSDATAVVNDAIAEGRLQQTFEDSHSFLTNTRSLLSDLKEQIDAVHMPETATLTRQTVEDLAARTAALSVEIGRTLEDLRQASDTLEKLLERLYARPSDLLYSQPLPTRRGTR